MDHPKTMRVKPWGEGQGDHVIINESDFDPEKHTPIDGADYLSDAPDLYNAVNVVASDATSKKKTKRKAKRKTKR